MTGHFVDSGAPSFYKAIVQFLLQNWFYDLIKCHYLGSNTSFSNKLLVWWANFYGSVVLVFKKMSNDVSVTHLCAWSTITLTTYAKFRVGSKAKLYKSDWRLRHHCILCSNAFVIALKLSWRNLGLVQSAYGIDVANRIGLWQVWVHLASIPRVHMCSSCVSWSSLLRGKSISKMNFQHWFLCPKQVSLAVVKSTCRPLTQQIRLLSIHLHILMREWEWALLARYVYTCEEFVIVTKAPQCNRMKATGQDTDHKIIIYKYTNRQCTK